MRLITLCLLLIFFLAEKNNAQMQLSPAGTFAEALDFMQFEEYEEALALFLSIYNKESVNHHISHLIGVCYLNIGRQKQKGLPFLEAASANMSANHITGSFDEKTSPLSNMYYLGIAYRHEYRFSESLDALNRFKETAVLSTGLEAAEREITLTKNAMMFYKNREDITILDWENKPPVRPWHSNIVVSGDESTMVYAEKQKFYDAVFYTRNTGEGWSLPVNVTRHLQSDGMAYPVCLSWDGKELYLYQYDRLSNVNLYLSRFVDGRWSVMEKLGENINSAGFDQHATITRDGKTLYFASVRPSGTGGFDIYRSRLGPDNQWGPAENLGHPINTEYDDSYPFISPDGQTLYFSSRGHTGMGGFDIFVSRKTAPGKWSVPRNLGYPLNTPGDDTFLIPVGDGSIAYYSKRREENSDIREFQKITSFDVCDSPSSILSLEITAGPDVNAETGSINLVIRQSYPADSIIRITSAGNRAVYELELPWGEYGIETWSPGYETGSISFVIPEYYPEQKYNISAVLAEVLPEPQDGQVIEKESAGLPGKMTMLQNHPVFFGFDKHDLCEASVELTGYVATIMKDHAGMVVELQAYTDALGPAEYNILLAARRAEAIENALADRGVDRQRITSIAMGMGNYITRNTTPDGRDNPEGRKYNRRVEFVFSNIPSGMQIENVLVIPPHLLKTN